MIVILEMSSQDGLYMIRQIAICGSWALSQLGIFDSPNIYIMSYHSSKITVKSSNENDFVVGGRGHHNLRSCIKWSQR